MLSACKCVSLGDAVDGVNLASCSCCPLELEKRMGGRHGRGEEDCTRTTAMPADMAGAAFACTRGTSRMAGSAGTIGTPHAAETAVAEMDAMQPVDRGPKSAICGVGIALNATGGGG